jgi:hypothetical protein
MSLLASHAKVSDSCKYTFLKHILATKEGIKETNHHFENTNLGLYFNI